MDIIQEIKIYIDHTTKKVVKNIVNHECKKVSLTCGGYQYCDYQTGFNISENSLDDIYASVECAEITLLNPTKEDTKRAFNQCRIAMCRELILHIAQYESYYNEANEMKFEG